jgi:excisionase family DNA binding protein
MMNERGETAAGEIAAPWLVRVEEAAQLCRVSRARMYQLVGSGEIPSLTIGRARRVPIAELRRWLDSRIEQSRKDEGHANS